MNLCQRNQKATLSRGRPLDLEEPAQALVQCWKQAQLALRIRVHQTDAMHDSHAHASSQPAAKFGSPMHCKFAGLCRPLFCRPLFVPPMPSLPVPTALRRSSALQTLCSYLRCKPRRISRRAMKLSLWFAWIWLPNSTSWRANSTTAVAPMCAPRQLQTASLGTRSNRTHKCRVQQPLHSFILFAPSVACMCARRCFRNSILEAERVPNFEATTSNVCLCSLHHNTSGAPSSSAQATACLARCV